MDKDHFSYTISDIDKTGIYIISVFDSRTGFTVRTAIPDHGKQSASVMAFAGARYSRSKDTAEDIFAEIREAGGNAQEKLANIFRNYGHASVADMANLFLYLENIPKHYEARFFNETSIGGGQGRSTRYQDFGQGTPSELKYYFQESASEVDYDKLNDDFIALQTKGMDYFNTWKEVVKSRYIEYYKIDTENKKEMGALAARVFDSARGFLPSGLSTRTSIGWITNAREWARLIGVFKGSSDVHLGYLAEQIEALLAPTPEIAADLGYVPEAPDLIRYTQSDEKTQSVREQMRGFLATYEFVELMGGDSELPIFSLEISPKPVTVSCRQLSEFMPASYKVAIEHIILEFPTVDIEYCQSFLYSLSDEAVAELSQILFNSFDHHTQMNTLYRVNQLSYELTMSNAEAIDFNRHRAWGRFSPLWLAENTAYGCLHTGYVLPMYISDIPELVDLKIAYTENMDDLYAAINAFIISISEKTWFKEWIIPQMLPLAHNARLIMHGSIKEVSYMTKLRVRPGGHINYRESAWQIAQQTAFGDPLLARLEIVDRPDPASRGEFVDRS